MLSRLAALARVTGTNATRVAAIVPSQIHLNNNIQNDSKEKPGFVTFSRKEEEGENLVAVTFGGEDWKNWHESLGKKQGFSSRPSGEDFFGLKKRGVDAIKGHFYLEYEGLKVKKMTESEVNTLKGLYSDGKSLEEIIYGVLSEYGALKIIYDLGYFKGILSELVSADELTANQADKLYLHCAKLGGKAVEDMPAWPVRPSERTSLLCASKVSESEERGDVGEYINGLISSGEISIEDFSEFIKGSPLSSEMKGELLRAYSQRHGIGVVASGTAGVLSGVSFEKANDDKGKGSPPYLG